MKHLRAIIRQFCKTGFQFLLFFILSYIIGQIVIDVTNVKLASTINLNLFSFWLSSVIASIVLLLENDQIILHIKISSSNLSRISLLTLVIGGVVAIFVYETINFSGTAFEEWNTISLLRISFVLIVFLVILYAPAYMLHKTLLRKFKWNTIERMVCYPILSAPMLILLKVVGTIAEVNLPYRVIFVGIVSGLLILFLNRLRCPGNVSSSNSKTINVIEVLTITFAIGFNLFILYSAIGGQSVFLRGDMWGEAHTIALLNNYGLKGYVTSPIEDYPPLYPLFWSALLNFLPFPYLNGLLIIAFFNHIFSILSFYMLSRLLLKDLKKALLAVVLWTTVSGFSWVYLLQNPPHEVLSGNELLDYILEVSSHFGVYSGAVVSPIYADDHALTRLWSLGLLFVSAGSLLKAHFSESSLEGGLLLFSLGFIQIMLGHITEVPLLALTLFLLILIKGHSSLTTLKMTLLSTLILSIGSTFIVMLIHGLNKIFILISFTPLLAFVIATILHSGFNILRKIILVRNFVGKISRKLNAKISILFLYFYGLMWIAFLSSPMWINWPIATLWYFPAVEWGFLGLMSIVTIAWLGLKKSRFPFGLKFSIFLLLLQLALLICLNYLNYNFFFIHQPYPFHPLLFFPVLSLIASNIFPTTFTRKRSLHRRHFCLSVALIVIFSISTLDHILSSSYWMTNSGWWWRKPLSLSYDDYELINFLYNHSSKAPYEFVGTLYDWHAPSSYIVYPTGMAVLSKPLIDIFSWTNNSKEMYILKYALPINYILLSKEFPLPPINSLNFDGIDDYIEIPATRSLNVSVFTIEAWIRLNEYSPYLCPIIDRATDKGGYSFWIGGDKHSKGKLILNGGLDNDAESVSLTVELNEWTHVVVVWDGNVTTFYKNGISETKTGYSFNYVNALTTRVGNERWAFDGQFLNGDIGYVRIYNRALNKNEIALLYHRMSSDYDSLVLWLDMSAGAGKTVNDISGKGNNGTIFGAQWRKGSYLLDSLSSLQPIFDNDKYALYSIDQLNLSTTYLLPKSKDFLTAEKIVFDGNITIIDDSNSIINMQNTQGEIYPIDEGRILISIRSDDNVLNNIVVLTPHLSFNGNVTLVKMKSTWGYFFESHCNAEKITISGQTFFEIFNTVKNRIYLETFSYEGEYTVFPFPEYLRPDYAKEMIKNYIKTNYVDHAKTVASISGAIWTLIIVVLLFFALTPPKTIKRAMLSKFHFKEK